MSTLLIREGDGMSSRPCYDRGEGIGPVKLSVKSRGGLRESF